MYLPNLLVPVVAWYTQHPFPRLTGPPKVHILLVHVRVLRFPHTLFFLVRPDSPSLLHSNGLHQTQESPWVPTSADSALFCRPESFPLLTLSTGPGFIVHTAALCFHTPTLPFCSGLRVEVLSLTISHCQPSLFITLICCNVIFVMFCSFVLRNLTSISTFTFLRTYYRFAQYSLLYVGRSLGHPCGGVNHVSFPSFQTLWR